MILAALAVVTLVWPVNLYSEEVELSSTSRADAVSEINNARLRKPKRISLSAAQKMVDNIAEDLQGAASHYCMSKAIDKNQCQWDIAVHPSSSFNAYATGQNEIVIFSGLLNAVSSKEEVAFVLAHEIAHHIANHIDATRARSVIGATLAGLAAAATGDVEFAGKAASVGASVGALMFSVDQEKEADEIALMLLSTANYKLENARVIIIRMARQGGGISSGFLASHPSGPERLIHFDQKVSERDL